MEKQGLERSIAFILSEDLTIGRLITDQHRQNAKWIQDNLPDFVHLYDVWHIAKGKLDVHKNSFDCRYYTSGGKSAENNLAIIFNFYFENMGQRYGVLLSQWHLSMANIKIYKSNIIHFCASFHHFQDINIEIFEI